jgi:choline dehydrogenase-like flavoprotein
MGDGPPASDLTADVAVIGAGPAGLCVSSLLARRGLDTLLLEAGPERSSPPAPVSPHDPVFSFRSDRDDLFWYRVYGLGGRAALWGGWMSRFSDRALEAGGFGDGRHWLPAYQRAEAWAGVRPEPLHPRHAALASAFDVPVLPKSTGTFPLGGRLPSRRTGGRGLCLETIATGLELRGSTVEALRARGPSGRAHTVRARAFVLAASPVETTRLLMASGLGHPALGRDLADHVSLTFALVQRGGARIHPAANVPCCWIPNELNLDRSPGRDPGFCLEVIGPESADTLAPALREKLQLHAGEPATVTTISAMGERRARPSAFVALASTEPAGERDAIGRPLPYIHFGQPDGESALATEMGDACLAIADELAAPGSTVINLFDGFARPTLFHPSGTARMGDRDGDPCRFGGRTRWINNVWIADASVFPTPGDCHPTLTVLAHAHTVADDVDAVRSRSGRR